MWIKLATRVGKVGQFSRKTLVSWGLITLLFSGFIFYAPSAVRAAPTLVTTIPLGTRPQGVAFNPATNRIYIADTDGGFGNTVQVVDSLSNSVTATITVGPAPTGIAVNPNTNEIYVANTNNGTVSVIAGTTNSVTATITLTNTNTNWIAVNPNTNQIYVTASGGGKSIVGVIDGSTNTLITTIPVGNGPQGIAVNPTTNRIYVAEYAGPGVAVIDGNTNTVLGHVSGLPPSAGPFGIGVNPVTNRIYATNDNNTVSVIDGASNAVISNISTPALFGGVVVNSAANRIYVTTSNDNLSVIDGSTNSVVNSMPLGTGGLYDIAFNPGANRLYITDYNGRSLIVLDDVVPPTLSKAFSDNVIPLNGTTTLSFTLTNPNAGGTLTGVGFSDPFPGGLQIAATPNLSNTCGGAVSSNVGSAMLVLNGGTLDGGKNCTIKVDVTGTTSGTKDNVTAAISANESGLGGISNHAYLVVQNIPAAISAIAGSSQLAPVNSAYATALQAKVVDNGGTPLKGINVTFQAPLTGASGTFSGGSTSATAITDSGGVATAPVFTANSLNGSYTVTARVTGLATPASFSLTNLPVSSSNGLGQSLTFQINPAHTGAITVPGLNPPLAQKWSVDLGAEVSYPVIADGMVFVSTKMDTGYTYGTRLYGLNANNGQIVWGPVDFPTVYYRTFLAYENGRLFAMNEQAEVRAYAGASGTLLWSRTLTPQYSSSSAPVAYNGLVYVNAGGSSGTLFALKQTDGSIMWQANTENFSSSPSVTDEGLYISQGCDSFKFNPLTGAQIWRYNRGCSGGGGMTGAVYGGKFYAPYQALTFDTTSGALVGGIRAAQTPVFDNEIGFFVSGTGVLEARDTRDNALLWSVDGGFVTSPVVINGLVYIGNGSGQLFGYSGRSGLPVWTGSAGVGIITATEAGGGPTPMTGLGVGEGLLIVPATTRLVAFNPTATLQIDTPANSVAGTAFNVTVTAKDAAGRVNSTYQGTVHFTSNDSQAVLPPDYTFVAGDNGTHAFNVTLKSAGSRALTATDTGSASLYGVAIVNVTPANPATISANAGANQSASVNTIFSIPFEAKVTDTYGNVVSGIAVTFQAPANGASGTFSGTVSSVTVSTSATGIAVAPNFTANGLTGSYAVTAALNGVVTPASFNLINLPTSTLVGQSVAYQINASHTGAIRMTSFTTPLTTKWSVDLGGLVSYPIIAQGKVYLITRNAVNYGVNLYALDATNGAIAWGPIGIATTYFWANATYDNGKLFVQTYSATMIAYDATTGTQLWIKPIPGQYSFSSPPTAYKGVVYTGGAGFGGTVYAVSESNGTILWTAQVANGDNSSPVVTDEGVYVSYSCPNIYKLNPANGAQLWHYGSGCSGGGGKTPVLYNGKLYARDNGLGVILDSANGTALGNFQYGPAPAFDNGIGFFNHSGTLDARNASTQELLWSVSGSFVTAPLVVNGLVFVGTGAGDLYAYDTVSGAEKWHGNAGAGINGPDEQNVSQPLTGLGAGENLLIVPAGSRVVAFASTLVPTYSSNPAPGSTFATGHVQVGMSISTTLTISNTGSAVLTVNSPILSGTNAADFAVTTPSFPVTISQGGPAVEIAVHCTPSFGGTRTAKLFLNTNDPAHSSVSYDLNCSGDTIVTNKDDNGLGDTPGTLSYLLKNRVGAGQTISFSLPTGNNTITVTNQLPQIPDGVTIQGSCGANRPTITIKAGMNMKVGSDGLILSRNVTLSGLKLLGFPGRAIRNTGLGNHLICTQAVNLANKG